MYCSLALNHQYLYGLVQDCSNSSALALELLQSCTKPSIYQVSVWNSVKKVVSSHARNLNHKHKIDEKSTKSSWSSSKVVSRELVQISNTVNTVSGPVWLPPFVFQAEWSVAHLLHMCSCLRLLPASGLCGCGGWTRLGPCGTQKRGG